MFPVPYEGSLLLLLLLLLIPNKDENECICHIDDYIPCTETVLIASVTFAASLTAATTQ